MLNTKIEKRKQKISDISREAKLKKVDAAIYKNVMSKFKEYFENEEITELTFEMQPGVSLLNEDEKGAVIKLTKKLFDRYDVDKNDALDFQECKVIFDDIFKMMGCSDIFSDSKY